MFKAHIKLIVLEELSKKNLSGYDLIRDISDFSKKPSPGYMYPLLNDLKENKFISVKQDRRKKVYSITQKGINLLYNLKKNRDDMVKNMTHLWGSIADKHERREFKRLQSNMHKTATSFKDKVILYKFHKTLFSVYKFDNSENRKKIRKIIEDSISKLERVR